MQVIEPLTVPGILDSLDAIADYVIAAAAAANLDEDASYKLRQAVDEIATNIIIHGYEEGGCSGEIALEASFDDRAILICLEDTSHPYDPTKKTPPDDLDKPLEQRQVGGLGVYLAIHNVDKFIYELIGNRNRNTFILNIVSR